MNKELLVERIGPVARLTLNRPEAMNALTTEMLMALERAVEEARVDDDVRVLVITGVGKAFCAGADLKAFEAAQVVQPGERDFLELAAQSFGAVASFPKPVIAALNGITMAGGLELAMCVDLIVASETARIGDGHATFGVYPGGGGAAVLPRLIPQKMAMYLLFTGKTLPAAELKALGLVCEVHPADSLQQATLALAEQIAGRSPIGLRRMKEVARSSMDKSRQDALRHEQVMLRQHLRSWDMQEGLRAFSEKRAPVFRGR